MQKVFYSRQIVKCPKANCYKEIRRDCLASHLSSIHGEQSQQLAGQSTLTDMFAKKQAVTAPCVEPLAVQQHPFEPLAVEQHTAEQQLHDSRENQLETDQANILTELRQLKELQQAKLTNKSGTSKDKPIQYNVPEPNHFHNLFAGHTKAPKNAVKSANELVNKENIREAPQPQAETASVSIDLTTDSNPEQLDVIDGFGNQSSQLNLQSTSSISGSTNSVKKKSSIRSLFSKFSFKKRKRANLSNMGSRVSMLEQTVEEKLETIDINVKQVNEGLNTLMNSLSHLSVTKESTDNTVPTSEHETQILKAKAVLVRSSKSIAELQRFLPEMQFMQSENKIECGICVEPEASVLKPVGVITYDFGLGTNFSDINAPREFLNLKKKLVSHLESNHHLKSSKEAELKNEQDKKLLSRNYKVGMTLGLQAYQILKTGGSFLRFETDVATLASHGVDVGNINHSRKFCSEFSKSVFEVLQNRLKVVIDEPLAATGRQIPFSIVCDKLTPNRMTMQIVAIHGYIGSKFQSLVAGVPALNGNDGLSVTKCVRKGLETLKMSQNDLATRLVGGAFDGEYFNLSVPNHLSNMLLLSDEQRQWYTYQWDPAHILELAEKDARKGTPSIKKILTSINNVSKSFSHGKSFRELVEEAATEDEKARTPGNFSDTRFATYSSIALEKFLHNYKYYYKVMNRAQSDDLDKIDNAHFLFSLGALIDTYDVVGKLSNALQKPGMPHWAVNGVCQKYICLLKDMETQINSADLSLDTIRESELFPTLSKIVREVSETGGYQGCAILIKQHSVHLSRQQSKQSEYVNSQYSESLSSSSKVVAQFVRKFEANLSGRLDRESERNPILKCIDTLFDVKNIIKFDSGSTLTNEALKKYVSLAQSVGALEDDISFKSIQSQYETFASRIKEEAPKYRIKDNNIENQAYTSESFDDLKIYSKMLETPNLYNNISDVLHLALTGLSRSHCEAVVEGMGSVLGLHSENRTSLNPKTVEMETVIRWQGPHPTNIAKPLVETSLDDYFKGRNKWHFCVSWEQSKHFARSEVLSRIDNEAQSSNKIPF